jgi:hypothetical protein
MHHASPFQQVPPQRWIVSHATAFAIADAFPVSRGQTLVITKRVIATWWETTDDETS